MSKCRSAMVPYYKIAGGGCQDVWQIYVVLHEVNKT